MFVVVKLDSCKLKIVVPESWVYDINQELLRNQGVNSNRPVLVYWSKNGYIGDVPDESHPANFHLNKATQFPPANGTDEACYTARLIRYFGEYLFDSKIVYIIHNEKLNSEQKKRACMCACC